MNLSAGTHLGPYEILGPIGEGGMGVVYRARDPRLERQVAIKLLPHGLAANPDAQERLRFEAIAAAALDHPYICKIYEVGEQQVGENQGDVYLVMEYIAGETLRQRLARGRLPLTETQRIAAEITDALEAAHAGGILHRDLKPANIMLTQQGHVKIMDFGLAKRMASLLAGANPDSSLTQLTMPGTILGTPAYMSPEQVKGQPLDARSDLFSFGVILAEMASGVSPFQRPSMAETMTAVLHDPPHLSPDLPPATTAILGRLLAKAPEDRYASAGELRRHLNDLATPSFSVPAPAFPAPVFPVQESWTPVRVPQLSSPAQPVSHRPILAPQPILSQPTFVPPPPPDPLARLSARERRKLLKSLEHAAKPRRFSPWLLVPLFFILPSIFKTARKDLGSLVPALSKAAILPTPHPIRSITVLPFDNDSGDPTQNFLAEGLAQEIASELATITQLRVVSPGSETTSTGDHHFPIPQLKVDALLEGTVRRTGDTVRLSAQLIDARTGNTLGSSSLQRKSSDVLTLENDLASAVAGVINIPLSPGEKTHLATAPTVNSAAHDAYLKGRLALDQTSVGPPGDANLKKSIGFFQQAVRLSPNFAPAWSGLADAYLRAGGSEDVLTAAEARPKARAAAEKAVALDTSSAAAHTSLAVSRMLNFDWPGSDAEFKQAIALNPSDVLAHDRYGLSLAMQGRIDEALDEGKRARVLDPLSPQVTIDTLPALILDGDDGRAREAVKLAQDLDPTSFLPHWAAAEIDLELDQPSDAIPELLQAKTLGAPTLNSALLGYAYAKSGDRTRALAQIDDLKKSSPHGRILPFNLALIYLGLGDHQRALDYLEQAQATDSQWIGFLKEDKIFAPLHTDPRYLALLNRLNLKP